MKPLLFGWILFAGQAIPHQQKPVVLLKPNTSQIEASFDGSLLKLIQAPPTLYLPAKPPQADALGNPWTVEVKNLGPLAVTVIDKQNFNAPVAVGQTIHILSDGRKYLLTR